MTDYAELAAAADLPEGDENAMPDNLDDPLVIAINMINDNLDKIAKIIFTYDGLADNEMKETTFDRNGVVIKAKRNYHNYLSQINYDLIGEKWKVTCLSRIDTQKQEVTHSSVAKFEGDIESAHQDLLVVLLNS